MSSRTWALGLLLWLVLISMGGSVKVALAAPPCSVEAVRADVQRSLVGNVEVSTLRVRWRTANEGLGLDAYEIWARDSGHAWQLVTTKARGRCPRPADYDHVVAFDPRLVYYLEIHASDGSIYSLRVPIASESL